MTSKNAYSRLNEIRTWYWCKLQREREWKAPNSGVAARHVTLLSQTDKAQGARYGCTVASESRAHKSNKVWTFSFHLFAVCFCCMLTFLGTLKFLTCRVTFCYPIASYPISKRIASTHSEVCISQLGRKRLLLSKLGGNIKTTVGLVTSTQRRFSTISEHSAVLDLHCKVLWAVRVLLPPHVELSRFEPTKIRHPVTVLATESHTN